VVDGDVVFQSIRAGDVIVVRILCAPNKTARLINSPFEESGAVFSPDGRFVTYVSDESGRAEIYVRPFPGPGSRVQVSSEGGVEPVWSRDGRELFFMNGRDLLAVPIQTGSALTAGCPQVLFGKSSDFHSVRCFLPITTSRRTASASR
jgi:Tol biopolymer transport system component